MEQIFKINFKRHTHMLSEKNVGECLVSDKHFIGEIEIEDITREVTG